MQGAGGVAGRRSRPDALVHPYPRMKRADMWSSGRERARGLRGRNGRGQGNKDPTTPFQARIVLSERRLSPGMQAFERKVLLERVDREGATIGASIPETMEVQGESVRLREFVFEVKKLDTVPDERMEEVAALKKQLRRERLQRRQRLEEADISKEEGEALVDAIIGLDRALHALENLGPTDLAAEERAANAADTKRWFSFLRDVLGRDEDQGVRR